MLKPDARRRRARPQGRHRDDRGRRARHAHHADHAHDAPTTPTDPHHPGSPQGELAVSGQAGRPRARALTVAVLAGGRSSEHEVSLSSGAAVRDGLLAAGHEVLWVEIGRDGVWRQDGEPLSADARRGPARRRRRVPRPARALRRGRHGPGAARDARRRLRRRRRGRLGAVHGQGALQGADVRRGAAAGRLRRACARERFAPRSRGRCSPSSTALGLPVFVKPAHLGSSVGIVKVGAAEALRAGAGGAPSPTTGS